VAPEVEQQTGRRSPPLARSSPTSGNEVRELAPALAAPGTAAIATVLPPA